MSPPLREPLSQRGGWAGTLHFTVLAAGPGAFRAIVQRWELAAAQELDSWCCLTPCKWLTSHDLTAKGTLQRAAVHVPGRVAVESQSGPLPSRLSWLQWLFPPQGAAAAKMAHRPQAEKGWGEGAKGPATHRPVPPAFPNWAWSRPWAWLATRRSH